MTRKMTREDELWSMTGNTLLTVAEKLGIATTKSTLKKGKEPLIDKILEAEKKLKNGSNKKLTEASEKDAKKEVKETSEKTVKKIEKKPEVKKEVKKEAKKKVKTSGTRSNLKLKELTYKGKTKSIREWAEELNMPWATLYDRVNRNGWTTEEAIETPLGQKKSR